MKRAFASLLSLYFYLVAPTALVAGQIDNQRYKLVGNGPALLQAMRKAQVVYIGEFHLAAGDRVASIDVFEHTLLFWLLFSGYQNFAFESLHHQHDDGKTGSDERAFATVCRRFFQPEDHVDIRARQARFARLLRELETRDVEVHGTLMNPVDLFWRHFGDDLNEEENLLMQIAAIRDNSLCCVNDCAGERLVIYGGAAHNDYRDHPSLPYTAAAGEMIDAALGNADGDYLAVDIIPIKYFSRADHYYEGAYRDLLVAVGINLDEWFVRPSREALVIDARHVVAQEARFADFVILVPEWTNDDFLSEKKNLSKIEFLKTHHLKQFYLQLIR